MSVLVFLVAGCSSPNEGGGYYTKQGGYGTTGSVMIPSEPVGQNNGNGDSYTYANGYSQGNDYGEDGYRGRAYSRAPFASSRSDYQESSVQRSSLAPVASYSGNKSYADANAGNYGNAYAMQPVIDNDRGSNGGGGQRLAYDDRPRNGGYYGNGSGNGNGNRNDRRYEDERAPRPYSTNSIRSDDYVVAQGDTVYSVARRFRLSTDELMEINRLKTADIHPGQRLRVTSYTGTSGPQAPYYENNSANRAGSYNNGRRYSEADGYDQNGYYGYDRPGERRANPVNSSYTNGRNGYEQPDYARQRNGYDDDRNGYGNGRGYRQEPAPQPRYQAPPAMSGREDTGYGGTRGRGRREAVRYTVQQGDTIFEIARRNGMSHRELSDYNDIPLTAKLYPGQVLNIPKGRGYDWNADDRAERPTARRGQPNDDGRVAEREPKPAPRTARPVSAAVAEERPAGRVEVSGGPNRRTAYATSETSQHEGTSAPATSAEGVRPEGAKVAARECEALLANPAQRSAKTFREPVQGMVISKFGAKEDGSFNDGINFSVPKGTAVKASENGVVAYAGDELAGFGKLILVRHADGFVTAYANNDELLVGRCDVVKRGQVIGKAGATGNATKPQLHFELRKDSRPVDPEAYFSRS